MRPLLLTSVNRVRFLIMWPYDVASSSISPSSSSLLLIQIWKPLFHLLLPSPSSFFLLHISLIKMSRSNASSSNAAAARQGLLPLCGCRIPMRMWIASTNENRGRRFWKCSNSGKGLSCDLFIWDDELDFDRMPMVSIREVNQFEAMQCTTQPRCQCKCGEFLKEFESKKIAKLKLKVLDERKKISWMQGIIVMLILFVAIQKIDFLKM